MDGNQIVINIVKAITFGSSQPYVVVEIILISMLIISMFVLIIGTCFDDDPKIKSTLFLSGFLGLVVSIMLLIPVSNAQHVQHTKVDAQFMRVEKPRYYHTTQLVNQSETQLIYLKHKLSMTTDSKKAEQLSAQTVDLKNHIQQLKYQQVQIAKRIWNRENRDNPINHDIWYRRAYIKELHLF